MADRTLPLGVLAVGGGGVEELRETLDDATVAWALLRFQVGKGAFARTKFVSVHFNGDDVPTVRRGQLNARTSEALPLLGEVHARIEVKRSEDLTVDLLLERLLPFLVADSNLEGDTLMDTRQLKQEYEKSCRVRKSTFMRKASSQSVKSVRRRTIADNFFRKVKLSDALHEIGQPRGRYNWALLEPTQDSMCLMNAGYGGLQEMKVWLREDQVLFGVLRFTFGGHGAGGVGKPVVKYMFLHWVGPKVPAVQRGQWNSKNGAAEKQVREYCSTIALRREAHDSEELQLEELIKELRRLHGVDSGARAAEGDSAVLTAEAYLQQLEQEQEEIDSQMAAEDEDDDTVLDDLPDVETAVGTVRGSAGEWDWALLSEVAPAKPRTPRAATEGGATIIPVAILEEPVLPPRGVDDSFDSVMAPTAASQEGGEAAAGEERPTRAAPAKPRSGGGYPSSDNIIARQAPGSSGGQVGRQSNWLHNGSTFYLQAAGARTGYLYIRSGRAGWFWGQRRYVECRSGRLRWWASEDLSKQGEPLATLALVGPKARWQPELRWGGRLELRRHTVPSGGQSAASGGGTSVGGVPGSGGPGPPADDFDRYVFTAEDTEDARDWVRVIRKHISYVELLFTWPMAPEGRQGDVQNYGIEYPAEVIDCVATN
eukprot:TRINITY_DN120705_c0_g1_i1.p1 TRINITY_DN120705_c0_g1~~TRINITY_DN120705_c0_g1_i1.p1  ORF type:complete len:654 (-),score=164.25 TRINITY_DN120705_c0_g1_i1:270-2231(-)